MTPLHYESFSDPVSPLRWVIVRGAGILWAPWYDIPFPDRRMMMGSDWKGFE